MIQPEWRQELHAYLTGTLRGLGVRPEIVGGVSDHVHSLFEVKPTTVLSDIVRELKKASTSWVQDNHLPGFGWQSGYAAFSVSAFERKDLISYIANQEAHHSKEGSADELRRMLDLAGVAFDPRYFE